MNAESNLIRCHGLTRNFTRCSRHSSDLFCREHKLQPLKWIISIIGVIASLVTILAFISKNSVSRNDLNTISQNIEILLSQKSEELVQIETGLSLNELMSIAKNAKTISSPIFQAANRYFFDGQKSKAMSAYTKALELDPRNTVALLIRGSLFLNEKRYVEARQDFDMAISTDSLFDGVHFAYAYRGIVHTNFNQHHLAIKDYTKSMSIKPKFIDPIYNRGLEYLALDQQQDALSDFWNVIKLDSTMIGAYENLGAIYLNMGSYSKALIALNKAIELKITDAILFNSRGNVHQYMGNYNSAIEDFNKAISLNPKFAIAYSNRGKVYFDLRAIDMALEDFIKAVELDKSNPISLSNRGSVYAALGQYGLADKDFKRAISLDPENKTIRNNIVRLNQVH